MKAVYLIKPKNKIVIEYGELLTPKPKKGEALIKVKACALNHLDLWLMSGKRRLAFPHVFGSDVSGVVEKINGQSRFKKGDAVMINPAIPCGTCSRCLKREACELVKILGAVVPGGCAEYITVPITQLYLKPKSISFEEAAAFPLTFLTAYHMLVGRAGLKKGETVFVWGASGGLGVAAIQIIRALGAHVIAAARTPSDAEKIKKIGAHHTVLYKKGNVVGAVKKMTKDLGVDVVFESIGTKTWQKSLDILRPYGRLVIAGTTSGNMGSQDLNDIYVRQLSIFGARMGTPEEFKAVLDLLSRGKIEPVVGKVFPLKKASEAMDDLSKRKHIGKIVLTL